MADNNSNTVTLLAGADIGPVIEPVDQIADLILPVLKQADLRFGQCERTYSDRGWPEFVSGGGKGSRADPSMISIWKTAGIDIVSMASNHTMDWGPEAALDTLERFRSMGKHVIGLGKNIEEARRPAIVERNGVKIAFLGYCSVMRDTQIAAEGKAGCAPMRAHTYYEPDPKDPKPGTPPIVTTAPYKDELEALQEDIRKARQKADVVVMSIHWGLHHIPKTICDYQTVVAHAAIDAGADLILGHHAHTLKAIEVYKGKVCFYSMGNFMTTSSSQRAGGGHSKKRRVLWNLWWYKVDAECLPPNGIYAYPSDSRKALLAKAVFSKRGVERVSFVPTFINPRAQPAAVAPSDPKFKEILEFIEWVSDDFPHQFRVDGNEIVVETNV